MKYSHNKELVHNARQLRKNMTKEERRLWYDFLRTCPQRVLRQKVIGPYIVDFYCATAGLVVELDGSQHFEADGKEKDDGRDRYFASLGLTVLRYSNLDIADNFEGVCQDILRHMEDALRLDGVSPGRNL